MKVVIGGLDLETTGLKQEEGHRIIEVGLLKYELDLTTMEHALTGKYIQRVNPQRAIDAKAQEVHGISFKDLQDEPTWDAVVDAVVAEMNQCQIIVAHNADFDAPFIGMEIHRVGRPVPSVQFFCSMKRGRWATPFGKHPNLGELCFACDVPYDPSQAHAAEYDIARTMDCFFIGLKRGFYKLDDYLQPGA